MRDYSMSLFASSAECRRVMMRDIEKLETVNSELLAALILIEKAWADTATNDKPALRSPLYDAMNKARVIIAKAEAQ